MPWGARQEVDYSHPAFLFHAERVIRAVLARYADHPAVIGYQVDNEPGMLLFHNRGSFQRFVRRLKAKYGDVDTLNREWGLTYWSHRLSDWSDLWTPDGNSLPQYDLAWRRYQADLTTEFIAWQAGIVREYAPPGQFVTTCIAYPRPAWTTRALVRSLDVTAGNPYYAMQDHLDATKSLEAVTPWTTTGVAGLLRQADRMFSSRQSPVPRHRDRCPVDRGAGVQPAALPRSAEAGGLRPDLPWRGDDRVLALAHPALRHRDVLGRRAAAQPGSRPGLRGAVGARRRARRHRRSAGRVRARRGRRDPVVDRQPLRAASSARPSPPPTGAPTGTRTSASSMRSIGAWWMPARRRGSCTPLRRATWERRSSPPASRCSSRLRCMPRPTPTSTCCATTPTPAATWWSASAPDTATTRRAPASSRGTRSPARMPRGCTTRSSRTCDQRCRGHRRRRPAGLRGGDRDALGGRPARDGADVLATYRHPRFSDFPAITTNRHGAGRITVVGCLPVRRQLAADIVRWAVPSAVASAIGAMSPPPSPSPRARCRAAAAPGSSSTGAGTRRRSRSLAPWSTPPLPPHTRRAQDSHSPPGRR